MQKCEVCGLENGNHVSGCTLWFESVVPARDAGSTDQGQVTGSIQCPQCHEDLTLLSDHKCMAAVLDVPATTLRLFRNNLEKIIDYLIEKQQESTSVQAKAHANGAIMAYRNVLNAIGFIHFEKDEFTKRNYG